MTPAPESPDAALARKLHEAGSGHDEWRVQDPVHGSYVVAYTSLETANPERDARTWLTAEQHQEGTYSHFVVAHQRVQTTADKLMQEAAAAITRLTAERDAALRDAERYRWLREAPDVAGDDLLSQLVRDYADKYLDAAIDSEMARAARSAQERGNV